MRLLILLIFFAFPFTPAMAANPKIETKYIYYDIEGKTAAKLKAQMKFKGPKRYWAYATWRVSWRGNCKVKLKISITLPRWKNKSEGSKSLQKNWQSMITKLKRHEDNHGKHGIKAAKEVVAKKCKNPHKIIKKWAKQDKIYDRKTSHGRKEGVRL